jgi:membrane protein DedA with SNARE-associated domain
MTREPKGAPLHAAMTFLQPYLEHYGVMAVFAIIYLESLGAPLPGETVLVAASVLATSGDMPILHLLLAVIAGAVLGDSTGYCIGRVGGRRLLQRYGPLVKLTPERLARFEALFQRHGALIVCGARFVVLLRQINGLVAGSMRMAWPRFLLANAAGAVLWASAWVLGPYLAGGFVESHHLLQRL